MFGQGATQVWSDTSRPSTIGEYVFQNPNMESKITEWCETGNVPNIILHGPAGTGKTSLINVIVNELINRSTIVIDDVLELNCSEATSIDVVRDQIMGFSQTAPFGSFKIIILEEFQAMSPQAQGSLKRVIEVSTANGNARFFLTTNEISKVNSAIISRCATGNIEIKSHNRDKFLEHGFGILTKNGVPMETEEDFNILGKYADLTYPDMRSFIGYLQQATINNKLTDTVVDSTIFEEILGHVVGGSITTARETILQNLDISDYISLYKFLYLNVNMFIGAGSTLPDEVLKALIIIKIRDALVKDTLVSDREICLSATLAEIWMLATGV